MAGCWRSLSCLQDYSDISHWVKNYRLRWTSGTRETKLIVSNQVVGLHYFQFIFLSTTTEIVAFITVKMVNFRIGFRIYGVKKRYVCSHFLLVFYFVIFFHWIRKFNFCSDECHVLCSPNMNNLRIQPKAAKAWQGTGVSQQFWDFLLSPSNMYRTLKYKASFSR